MEEWSLHSASVAFKTNPLKRKRNDGNSNFFAVDHTLYDQVEPFRKACEELFGNRFAINIEELLAARHRRSDEAFEKSMTGEMSMEEMYIYRGQKAFEDLGYIITDTVALILHPGAYGRL